MPRPTPAKLNYGSGGNGSAGHLAGEMFKQRQASLPCTSPTTAATRRSWRCCRPGRLQLRQPGHRSAQHQKRQAQGALAVTSAQTSPALPGVPPVANTLKGFEIDTWWGLVAPAGTPKAVIDKLNKAFVASAERARDQDPLWRTDGRTRAHHARAVRSLHGGERAKYQKLVKASGATVD
jgi:tripartite-type tricarboxylate transporter receptor subunit TctC